MVCTFFGHRNAPRSLLPVIENKIVDLIEGGYADTFYVGNQGNFDLMAVSSLKKLEVLYPFISYSIVLAYFPTGNISRCCDYSKTIFPDGIENAPPRFAISYRNKWLIDHSDIVITYVKYSGGGAAKFKALAQRRGKAVIELSD
ncbi:MAG: hypothetical protein ACI4JB_09250 [Porcipelethomonas sp.]